MLINAQPHWAANADLTASSVAQGSHTLVAKTSEHDSKLQFSIAAGEQKYFQSWISMGILTGWGIIDDFTPQEGKKCVSESDLVEPEAPTKSSAQ